MKPTPDFIAELTYYSTEKGGRKTPAQSGYRPHLEFDHTPGKRTTGLQRFKGQEWVEPGQTIEAEISLVSTHFFAGKLSSGDTFKFREGDKILGSGIVKKVLNESLLKNF